MRKNILSKICLLLISVFLFSCKAKKPLIVKQETTAIAENNRIKLTTITEKQSTFTTFSTKAETNLNLNGKAYDVSLNIRIKHQEGIWISVTAGGLIEVARVLITPDSLKIMDRVNNEYLKKPFGFIYDYANDKVDYQTLEALLVGNCIPFTLKPESQLIIINGILNLIGNEEGLGFKIVFNDQRKTSQILLNDDQLAQKLTVTTGAYEEISAQLMPSNLLIESKAGDKNIKVTMYYSKTVLNEPVDFPFNVPKRFSVID